MISVNSLDQYLQYTPQELRDIVIEVRNLISMSAPQATEQIHAKYISYFNSKRGGPVSAGICIIRIQADHVRLEFIHGAFLPDPDGLLQGTRKAKRFLRIDAYEGAPWEAVHRLIEASLNFDPRLWASRITAKID